MNGAPRVKTVTEELRDCHLTTSFSLFMLPCTLLPAGPIIVQHLLHNRQNERHTCAKSLRRLIKLQTVLVVKSVFLLIDLLGFLNLMNGHDSDDEEEDENVEQGKILTPGAGFFHSSP